MDELRHCLERLVRAVEIYESIGLDPADAAVARDDITELEAALTAARALLSTSEAVSV